MRYMMDYSMYSDADARKWRVRHTTGRTAESMIDVYVRRCLSYKKKGYNEIDRFCIQR